MATHTDSNAGFFIAALVATGAVVLLILCVMFRRISLVLLFVVPLAVAAAVVFSAAVHLDTRQAGDLAADAAAGSEVVMQLRATSDADGMSSQWGARRYKIEAAVDGVVANGRQYGSNARMLLIGGEPWADVGMGDRIRATGKLAAPPPGSGFTATLYSSAVPQVQAQVSGWASATSQMRATFRDAASNFGPDVRGLLPGMVLGDRSMLTDELETAMKSTGLTHLTAVSGSNCAFVLAFAFLCARLCRLPRGLAVLLAMAALSGFVLLVRPDPSVLRAAVMGSLGVLAVLSGRGKLSFGLLQVAVIFLIVADPWIHAEYGFILSVLATTGLILIGPPLVTVLSSIMPRAVAVILSIPMAAQMLCTPVILTLDPTLPTYSVPANILASPVVPFITILGMIGVLAGSIHPALALAPNLLAAVGTQWVALTARFFSDLPAASTPWLDGPAGIVLATLVTLLFIGCVAVLNHRLKRPPDELRIVGPSRKRRVLVISTALTAVLVILAVDVLPMPWQRAPQWNIAACDVGQGDGFAVRTGPKSAIVIDTGPEPEPMDRCLRNLGVEVIDLLVLTHSHADHYGGIQGVMKGRIVKKIAYSSTSEPLPKNIRAAIADVPQVPVTAGDAGQQNNVSWRVLWPAESFTSTNENNMSCVLLVSAREAGHETTILFTGDLEEDAAARLLAAEPNIASGTIDVLKVAHHGARNGGSRIVEQVRPRLAMISVGAKNTYGHPGPTIVNALESGGTTVLRTDVAGSFTLDMVEDKLIARSF
ncbi:DNA internalization-related competence protein ComEC/Rec2 [Arthrobacter roseus]|uniref:DNA internalization-related competence protein ComEC/Rec2 n=1 Tax=Arthrobacter roseus TaxID=136274 RepID=UPI001965FBD3|nr:DNA internalization-related competence protein ComEC/Rec2 [Arthrobacter roseus]MBM7848617.1 competence protein ComEC [Arthrobacter roseus]